jgi:hypothetical protein
MAEATINNPSIFDRKKHLADLSEKFVKKTRPSYLFRQEILASQNADGLSENELRNQVKELRSRRFLSVIPLVAIPAAIYYLKFNNRLAILSIIPAYILYHRIWNSSLLNKEISFSTNFAKKSKERFLNKITGANGRYVLTPEEIWNLKTLPKDRTISLKDWIARNEYR